MKHAWRVVTKTQKLQGSCACSSYNQMQAHWCWWSYSKHAVEVITPKAARWSAFSLLEVQSGWSHLDIDRRSFAVELQAFNFYRLCWTYHTDLLRTHHQAAPDQANLLQLASKFETAGHLIVVEDDYICVEWLAACPLLTIKTVKSVAVLNNLPAAYPRAQSQSTSSRSLQDMTYAVFAQFQSSVPIGRCRLMDAKYCIIWWLITKIAKCKYMTWNIISTLDWLETIMICPGFGHAKSHQMRQLLF